MLRHRAIGHIVLRHEGRRKSLLELVDLARIVSQPMIVCHVMEELLRIQRSTKQERKIPIRRLNDLRNDSDSGTSIERVLVRDAVLD